MVNHLTQFSQKIKIVFSGCFSMPELIYEYNPFASQKTDARTFPSDETDYVYLMLSNRLLSVVLTTSLILICKVIRTGKI